MILLGIVSAVRANRKLFMNWSRDSQSTAVEKFEMAKSKKGDTLKDCKEIQDCLAASESLVYVKKHSLHCL